MNTPGKAVGELARLLCSDAIPDLHGIVTIVVLAAPPSPYKQFLVVVIIGIVGIVTGVMKPCSFACAVQPQ